MLRHIRGLSLATALLLASALSPVAAHGQQASVLATATVLGQPLSLRSVTSTATGTQLAVGVEGCGTGSLTVDGQRSDGTQVRVTRRELTDTGDCRRRELLLPLEHPDSAQILRFEVRLSHADALLAPALAQIVINAAALRSGTRSALIY